jgi:hypothetical protein
MTNLFPQELREVIIGCTLGDLCIVKSKPTWNPYLVFEQSAAHWDYLYFLYTFFEKYCNTAPKLFSIHLKSTGRDYTKCKFKTRSLPIFEEFHTMFYLNGNKVIPSNIGEIITPRSLAFWTMDDGCLTSNGYGFYLCTHSFTKDEVLLLCSVFQDKFGISSSIHLERGKPKIYIKAGSLNSFRSLVRPYFHESMLYKLEKVAKK